MNYNKRFLIGSVAIFLLGSAFHFLYELLGRSVLAAPFFAVNESVWEHMKLLSTAALLWMAADWRLADRSLRTRFFAARAVSLPLALLSIPMVFYFVEGALGVENLIVDIGIFLIAAMLHQQLALRLEARCAACGKRHTAGVIALAAVLLLFAVFTFLPPRVPLFLDTPTGTYGIPG